MISPPDDLKKWIESSFFESLPLCVGVIDRDFNLIYANPAFKKKFGNWENQKCFNVYKNRSSECEECKSLTTFENGKRQISEETGYDCQGVLTHYKKHTIPIKDSDGKVKYLVEISIDFTESKNIRDEYQLLFDQVPCNILIIDRDFRIVRANKKAEEILGKLKGHHCYAMLKGRNRRCDECTARKTFKDGKLHRGHHVWTTKGGKAIHLHVITVPLMLENNTFDMVMELAVDVTRTMDLEIKLKGAHHYLESLIDTSMDGIIGVDNKGKVALFNSAARGLFNVNMNQIVSRDQLNRMLPKGFVAEVSKRKGHVYLPETDLYRSDGTSFSARLVGSTLFDNESIMGMAFSIQDLSKVKKLQKEKIEAERMAIVGQTIAGLAHGIKNLIAALEGGVYLLTSGLNHSDIKRVHKGLETISRNIGRISNFAKSFLNYSRERRIINLTMCYPDTIIQEVIDSFKVKAAEYNTELRLDYKNHLEPAPMDYEYMHECFTNLVGNALDACKEIVNKKIKLVEITIFEENRVIQYEIKDNGIGMDKETKRKVFNKFFTTKGLEGTGLGMLMSKKIVQEHGGRIDVISRLGKGSTFRIRLPRRKLPKMDQSK